MEKMNKQRKDYLNWDEYFMAIAKLSSMRSKDPSTQVGACIVSQDNRIRFIVDDCLKFVLREQRRGHKYDAIIMDPPSYGRGPSGEVWKFEDKIIELINACMDILSDKPLFFQVNSYTTGFSKTVLENVLKQTVLKKYPNGRVECDEIGLPIENSDLVLPCGIYGRWESK